MTTPPTVSVYVPADAAAPTLNVSTAALPVVLLALNAAVTPVGKPATDRLTLPVKAFRLIATFAVALPPGAALTAPGVTDKA